MRATYARHVGKSKERVDVFDLRERVEVELALGLRSRGWAEKCARWRAGAALGVGRRLSRTVVLLGWARTAELLARHAQRA